MTDTVQESTIELTTETMYGELCKVVIDEMKAAPDVWQKLSEDTQKNVIGRVQDRVRAVIETAVGLMAADGRVTITADIESVTIKDGIKAVLTLSLGNDQRHDLYDSQGKPVLIVVASAENFMGGDMPKADPAQGELPVADAAIREAA